MHFYDKLMPNFFEFYIILGSISIFKQEIHIQVTTTQMQDICFPVTDEIHATKCNLYETKKQKRICPSPLVINHKLLSNGMRALYGKSCPD